MAAALWGKVYYNDLYAGELRQEPGGRCVFTCDPTYLEAKHPAIAFTLPRRASPHICEQGLHPFFDNLVAEGWLRNAQARALKIDPSNRFALLLAFGHDCAGAVSVIDPAPLREPAINVDDPLAAAALSSKGSLSGVQPKLLAVREGRKYRPAGPQERSTFVAKLPSGTLRDLVENGYLTTIAVRALLPDDQTVAATIAPLEGIRERALLVRRFDRLPSGTKIHFEEFNQLLGRRSGDDKYDAAYEDILSFIISTPGTTQVDAWRLYRRLLVCFLTGNTDAHLKNFAMLHTPDGLRLTPSYDLVAAALYPEYRSLALSVAGAADLTLDRLRPKQLLTLGRAADLSNEVIANAVEDLGRRRQALEKAVIAAGRKIDAERLATDLLQLIERRWNGTFASTGRYLSMKRSGGATE
ncbi:MAG: type II toxin-antitoxin system HipA family toxin [Hyphomicrobiales bacterium]